MQQGDVEETYCTLCTLVGPGENGSHGGIQYIHCHIEHITNASNCYVVTPGNISQPYEYTLPNAVQFGAHGQLRCQCMHLRQCWVCIIGIMGEFLIW